MQYPWRQDKEDGHSGKPLPPIARADQHPQGTTKNILWGNYFRLDIGACCIPGNKWAAVSRPGLYFEDE